MLIQHEIAKSGSLPPAYSAILSSSCGSRTGIATAGRSNTMQQERTERDGRADFDFLMGRWTVHHRRLRERLKGSTSWEEFAGTSVARPLLGGLGNIDENIMERASGRLEGVSLRLYDPISRQW